MTSLADFVASNGLGLTRFAYVLCGDQGAAEDLVQDTYVAIYRRFGADIPIEAPVAYARRAITNAHISRGRLRSSTEVVASDLPDEATEGGFPDEQDAMWRALTVLPGRQRAVLVLRYYADLTDREIATTLDCREGTVRSLATRAFATLRQHAALRAGSEELT